MTIYATLLGGATREGRNGDLAALLAWGIARYRTVDLVSRRGSYATARHRTGGRALDPRGAGAHATKIVRVDRPLVEQVVAPSVISLPVRKGQALES